MKRVSFVAVLVTLPLGVSVAPAAAPGDGAYNAIIDLPLFDPSRKKYEPPVAPDVAPTDDTPVTTAPGDPTAPQLLGVVSSDSDSDAIVVVRGGDGQVVRLAQGEAVDGWRIVSIRPRGIDVEREGVTQSIELPEPGGPIAADPNADPSLPSP